MRSNEGKAREWQEWSILLYLSYSTSDNSLRQSYKAKKKVKDVALIATTTLVSASLWKYVKLSIVSEALFSILYEEIEFFGKWRNFKWKNNYTSISIN